MFVERQSEEGFNVFEFSAELSESPITNPFEVLSANLERLLTKFGISDF